MPPIVATVLCLGFIGYCILRERKANGARSIALWLPSGFAVVIGSRPVSLWLNPGGQPTLVDTAVNVGFVLAAGIVWYWRRSMRTAISPALAVFLGYCAISLAWSDSGLHAVEQYIRLLGMLWMAMIVAAEEQPYRAFVTVIRRVAFILVPVSLLFNKYYPQYGVGFDYWSGLPAYRGVADSKNMLGQLCMIILIVMVSQLLLDREQRDRTRWDVWLDVALVVLAVNLLLSYAGSATAIISTGLALSALALVRLESVKQYAGVFLLSGIAVGVGAEMYGGLSATVAQWFGRDPTLTNRTLIWDVLLENTASPLVGAGFEGYWGGERLLRVREMFGVNEAHNGYLEVYLNLGIVGIMVLAGLLASSYLGWREGIRKNAPVAVLGASMWLGIVVYNIAEAGWKGQSLVMFAFLFMLTVLPKERIAHAGSAKGGMARRIDRRMRATGEGI